LALLLKRGTATPTLECCSPFAFLSAAISAIGVIRDDAFF
jgi:hypothetical protein